MRRRHDPQDEQHSPVAIKLAWWAGFLATLALVFALAQAQSAQALTPSLPVPAFAVPIEADAFELDLEADEEDWEWEEGVECEVLGEEQAEEALCEGETADQDVPAECLLSSTETTVSAVPARGILRVSVRYTAHARAAVKVEYRLRGGKGPLRLGQDRERFNLEGTFRTRERLSERQTAKVAAARSFSVAVQAVNAPRYCHRHFDQTLTVKRARGGSITWSESPARAAARTRI